MNRYVGNLPPMPGVFHDYPAPMVRNVGTEREMVMMRWGMPPPPRAGGYPVTNIRNTSSPHWRAWLKPESRCLIPANSFAEYAPEPNPDTKKKDVVWFALNDVLRDVTDDVKGLKDYLDENGGVRIYRDGTRVYDFGEPGNDWLNLDIRRVNTPTARTSNNQVLGALCLDATTSGDLREKTNREGFIENDARISAPRS
jgi:hypothetical protein